MSVTQEDLQYLPYNDHNLGRIFTRNCRENIVLFIREFKESEFGSRLVAEGLATAETLDQILAETQRRCGHDDVNMGEYVRTAKSMWMNGDLEPEQHAAAAASAEPELTEPQLRWREYREFSETHSGDQCRARARVDAGYRSFMHKNLERELRSTPVGDAVESVGTDAVRQDRKVKITQELNDFAWEYRAMSAAEVRKNSKVATNPNAATFNKNVADCIAAGLI